MSDIKITEEQIDRLMERATFSIRTEFDKCTVVTAKLENGFILTESSACVDPKNYDAKAGEQICRERIRNRLWELEGYALQKKIARANDAALNGHTFSEALEAMKKGFGARLPHWSSDVVIRAQFPDEHSKMTHPYLYVESRNGRVPWRETVVEMFSEDWEIVD